MAKPILSYYGKVEDGKIELPKKVNVEVIRMFDGKKIEVIFRQKKKHRSNQQNAYYWAVPVGMIYEYLKDTDNSEVWTPEMVHEILKYKFLLRQRVNSDTGEVIYEYSRSTTDLTTSEFMDYLTKIQQWAAETFHINIPDPDEQGDLFDAA